MPQYYKYNWTFKKKGCSPYTLSSVINVYMCHLPGKWFLFFCSIFELIEEHGGNPILTALINELKKVYRGSQ